nr:hypothetical protein CFP56_04407 [Quercus suber]
MQQSSEVIALSVATLIIITYLKFVCPVPSLPRQWQHSLSMSNTGNNDSYTAPMLGRDDPKEVIPDDYQVFLHIGYSLDHHKRFVGEAVNFDSAIRSVLNETATHGLLYRAHLDQAAVAAVRADIGVDLLNCDQLAHPT